MNEHDPQPGNGGQPAAAEGVDEAGALATEETSGEGELSPRQERAIAALMTEQTILRAAQVAGVGERTLHKWLDRPNFAAEYRRVRREAFRQAVGMSQRFASAAVATLAKVMADPQSPYSAKVAAATALLKFGREGIEIEDLQVRVEDLERQAAGAGVVDQPTPGAWASRRVG
jgi:hypothetical protein